MSTQTITSATRQITYSIFRFLLLFLVRFCHLFGAQIELNLYSTSQNSLHDTFFIVYRNLFPKMPVWSLRCCS